MTTRLTSITTHSYGSLEPEREVAQADSPYVPIDAKWNHLKEEVKGKLWSECLPEMVADYVKATAETIRLEYGQNACQKLNQLMAASFMRNQQNSCRFNLATPEGLKVDIQYFVQSQGFAGGEAENATLGAVINKKTKGKVINLGFSVGKKEAQQLANIEPEEIAQTLHEYMNEPRESQPKFDPLKELDDSQFVDLVKQIEVKWSGSKIKDLDLLVIAASVLSTWQNMENNNASEFTDTFGGVNINEQEIRPGFDAVIKAQAKLLSQLTSKPVDEETVDVQFTVTANAKPRMIH